MVWKAAGTGFRSIFVKLLDMTIQEIKRFREATPFEPFRVLVADGNHFDVWHPESLGQSPSGRMITIGLEDASFA